MILIIVLFLYQDFIYAQTRKEEVDFLVKLTLFQEASGTKGYISNYKALGDFLKLEYKMDTLKSEGFDDFIFISVNPIFSNPKNISFEDGPFLIDNCKEFIIALNIRGRTIYKMKGFIHNDFSSFFTTLKYFNYPNLNSSKHFIKNYSVERLDLGCLYNAYANYSIDKNKYPCLLTCSEVVNVE